MSEGPGAQETRQARAAVLEALGAGPGEVEALLAYNENRFTAGDEAAASFPLADEPFVSAWEHYAGRAREHGVLTTLAEALVQLRFPVEAGMGDNPGYRGVTRRGDPPTGCPLATGLRLAAPDRLRLLIQPTAAGRIPVLVIPDRGDFENIVRALTARNEPVAVPGSMGAMMVSGYNNWDRISRHRAEWLRDHDAAGWGRELRRLMPLKHLYQDRFILVSEGPYSAVPAHRLGLTQAAWTDLSLTIRIHHECAHYFTKRVFASMRNNLLDELIADYAGIVAALGRYRADWFLRFVGLEDAPRYRPGGRLENYRGDPPLDPRAFEILQRLTVRAADTLERFDTRLATRRGLAATGRLLAALTHLTLEELAAPDAVDRLAAHLLDSDLNMNH